MIEVYYKPTFIKKFHSLEKSLQVEVLEKIELFKSPPNHKQLKVHKLHAKMKGFFSFSVNYRTRIIFEYGSRKRADLLTIGDHEIYS